ncbi:MAG: GDYXXLXY domain-containing protein [Bacteroidota bacterium]|nr:GDYXXLXY domain-containing protein [Bacteroidota bacterium]
MKKYSWIIILANLVVFLGVFNFSIIKKEKQLTRGNLIFLELSPVDPRSLLQGDYMQLRYEIANNLDYDNIPEHGLCAIELNGYGIAKNIRYLENMGQINTNEHPLKYTGKQWWGLKFGAESFFFQEGEGEKYEKVKYGGINVDENGNAILIGLYDVNLKKIE